MPLPTAEATYFFLTSRTLPINAITVPVLEYMTWLYPFPTGFRRTVVSILRGVFLIFLVPFHLEILVKYYLNIFGWNGILSAASRWHMLRIRNG